MILLAFALAYLAMLALCLAMARHHRAVFNTAPTPRRQRWLRATASGLLLGAALLNTASSGLAIGLVIALTQLMFAGLTVGLTLAWRERWVVPLGALLGVIGMLSAISGG